MPTSGQQFGRRSVEGKFRFRTVVQGFDTPELVKLAREAHAESAMSHINFSEAKVRKISADTLINLGRNSVFVCELSGDLVGFVHASIGEYYIGEGTLIATINVIYVQRSIRKGLGGGKVALGLFKATKKWALTHGARTILLHNTSGINVLKTHTFVSKMGYDKLGLSYALKL